ncbi:glycosyltransferase family 4 protein [Sporomusa aerivorans]|uniref:glycosyltransferase family 4 protein n=1 Tax=Sporomusa aerivorans TaxID=204936 RepID=UPI00352AA36E
MSLKPRAKIVVLSPFPVYPPISGGQGRIFHLYKHVARAFDVIILCLADRRSYKLIAPGLQQIMIPKSTPHCQMELEVFRESGFSTCAIIPKAVSLTPEYAHVANEQAKDAGIIILAHPYLYRAAQQLGGNRILVYDAHNVEYDLHRQILPPSLSHLLDDVRQAEKAACELSQIIAACSLEDSRRLASLYSISGNKFIIIPNGADTEILPYVSYEQRQLFKAAQDINRPSAIYMGSHFPPNLKAAGQAVEMAVQLPDVTFMLAGSVCEAFTNHNLPDNVALLGIISAQEQRRLFSLADVALNPVRSGSGTNLKMLEYMAAGIPVVTTNVGARGISQNDGSSVSARICRPVSSHF